MGIWYRRLNYPLVGSRNAFIDKTCVLPETGVSYRWKKLYGNIMYQFDTVNIKNYTVCFSLAYWHVS
jgi:hypothetical protein